MVSLATQARPGFNAVPSRTLTVSPKCGIPARLTPMLGAIWLCCEKGRGPGHLPWGTPPSSPLPLSLLLFNSSPAYLPTHRVVHGLSAWSSVVCILLLGAGSDAQSLTQAPWVCVWVCVCSRVHACVRELELTVMPNWGERERKGIARLYFLCVCVLKLDNVYAWNVICKKDVVRNIEDKETMSNVQSPWLPSSRNEGQREGWGVACDTILLLYFKKMLSFFFLTYYPVSKYYISIYTLVY